MNTDAVELRLRCARPRDIEQIEALQHDAMRRLGAAYYSAAQIDAFLAQVPTLDLSLVEDGRYYVIARGDDVVACGGWSLRAPGYQTVVRFPGHEGAVGGVPAVRAMYVAPGWARRGLGRRVLEHCETAIAALGYTHATLDALLPGVPLYLRCGYVAGAAREAVLPDGTRIAYVPMRKALEVRS